VKKESISDKGKIMGKLFHNGPQEGLPRKKKEASTGEKTRGAERFHLLLPG